LGYYYYMYAPLLNRVAMQSAIMTSGSNPPQCLVSTHTLYVGDK